MFSENTPLCFNQLLITGRDEGLISALRLKAKPDQPTASKCVCAHTHTHTHTKFQ